MTPLRVLIVDDEPPARARLRDLLDDCRAEVPNVIVGEAGNGPEGIDLLCSNSVDVALVDIHMPGMSGIEFARHIQGIEAPPAVIFVTAHDQYAVEAFEVNAVDYLLKPVRARPIPAAPQKAGGGAAHRCGPEKGGGGSAGHARSVRSCGPATAALPERQRARPPHAGAPDRRALPQG